MQDLTHLRTGALDVAVTEALVAVYERQFGFAPARASTVHHENVVVTVMQGALSKAERTLSENGRLEDVRRTRKLFRDGMEVELRGGRRAAHPAQDCRHHRR